MFNGTSVTRPKVSMRGKRKGRERNTLLSGAKEQREARAGERQRQVSALTLQRVFRGRRDLCTARQSLRQSWDERRAALEQVARHVQTQTGEAYRPPPHVALRMLREFLWLASGAGDALGDERLGQVADTLAAAAEVPQFWTVLEVTEPGRLPSVVLSLAAFVRRVLAQKERHGEEPRLRRALDAVLAPLRPNGAAGSATLRTAMLYALLCSVVRLDVLAKHGVLRILGPLFGLGKLSSGGGRVLSAVDELTGGLLLAAGVTLRGGAAGASAEYDLALLRKLEVPDLLDTALEGVALSLLTRAAPSPGPAAGAGAGGADASLARCPAATALLVNRFRAAVERQLDRPAAGLVGADPDALLHPGDLGRLVGQLRALPLAATPALRRPVLQLLGAMLRHDSFRLALRRSLGSAGADGGDDVDEGQTSVLEKEFRAAAKESVGVEGVWATPEAAAVLGQFLEFLTAKSLLRDALASASGPTEVLEVAQVYAHIALLDGSLLRNLGGAIDHWGDGPAASNLSAAVVHAVAFGRGGSAGGATVSPLETLWRSIASHEVLGRHLESKTYVSPGTLRDPTLAPLLLLYCAGLSHALVATDDEDFFVAGKPVPRGIALKTVHLLIMMLHGLLLTDVGLLGHFPLLALAVAATRLLRQLRERSARLRFSNFGGNLAALLGEAQELRAFLQDDLWTWPSSSSQAILAEMLPNGEVANVSDAEELLEMLEPQEDQGDVGDMDVDGAGAAPRHVRITRLLRDAPDLLPFQSRVRIFEALVKARKIISGAAGGEFGAFMDLDRSRAMPQRITVRRDQVFDDSFAALAAAPPLRGRLQVVFVNEHGMTEAGIDGGGLLKEWMDAVCKEVFDPSYGYFTTTGDTGDEGAHQVTPSFASNSITSRHLDGFRFAGRILGKALYEGILVEPQLAPPFLNKLLGRFNHVDDLKFLDPSLHKGLMSLKKMAREFTAGGSGGGSSGSSGGGDPVMDLGMMFQVTMETFGAHHEVNLVRNGDQVPVTSASALRYIHLLAHFKLNLLTKSQSEAFLQGFRELVPEVWLRMFNAPELQLLIGGDGARPLDLADLQANVNYGGGYHPSQPYVQAFWRCLGDLEPEQQAKFLRFVTSCSRQPLLGFRSLNPKIAIQQVPEDPAGRLPSAGTCMNLLKLPHYGDPAVLKRKLLYAINANAGFDLS